MKVKEIKGILKEYNIFPSKRLGQNFLIEKRVIDKIIKMGGIEKQDIVLEIGPGLGALTRDLSNASQKVIAVEKDPNMSKILKKMDDLHNVEIIHGDILKFNDQDIKEEYKVIGNLPFYLTAPVIRQFLESKNPPQEMILIIQKEVAQRICNKPPKMSILSVSVQLYADPKILFNISQKSFWPEPQVDASVLKLSNIQKNNYSKFYNSNDFFKIVKAGFSQPRKQLINNLSRDLKKDKQYIKDILENINILPNQRAETLDIKDWIKLTEVLK